MMIETEESQRIRSSQISLSEEQLRQVDVPGDGSCLFWAVALPYLIQVNNNPDLFSERFERLFGAKELIHSHHVCRLINEFHTSHHNNSIYDDKILRRLVTQVFRRKLVDQMSRCEDQFYQSISINDFKDMKNELFITNGTFRDNFEKSFSLLIEGLDIDLDKLKPEVLNEETIAVINIELDKIVRIGRGDSLQRYKFRMYLEAMKSSGSWGGSLEIEMMKRMLECEILVNFKNRLFFVSENSIVYLFNNQQIHYQFYLTRALLLIEFINQNYSEREISIYLNIGVDEINFQKPNGSTLLHFAAKNNHAESVQSLINQGADINARNSLGQTPLDIAISLNSQSFINALINCARENSSLVNEISAINKTIEMAKEGEAHLLLEFNKDGKNIIHIAAEEGTEANLEEILSWLAENGHLPHTFIDIPVRGVRKQTALHLAAKNNRVKVVEKLLRNQAKVNVRDTNSEGFSNWTPLHYAAEKGYLEVVKLLIEKGKAEINAPDRTKGSPLQRAVRFGQLSVVEYLVGMGADVSSRDQTSISILSYAAKAGCLQIVQFLLEKGAEINAVDKNSITPLHHAAKSCKWDIVKYLVTMGADPNVESNDYKTPLNKIVQSKQLELASFLVENGALTNDLSENQIEQLVRKRGINISKEFQINKLLSNFVDSESLEANKDFIRDFLPKIYDEITLLSVTMSQSASLFIESEIINYRLFSDRKGKELVESDVNKNIKERINLVVDAIKELEEINTNLRDNEISDAFLFVGKFIAQNMEILKRQLSQYSVAKLPFTQMQFCLVNFIYGYLEPNKSDVIYKLATYKTRIINNLKKIKDELEKFEDNNDSVEDFTLSFTDLYKDYELLRDIYSLNRIESYLNPACLVDLSKGDVLVGEQVILRALQVTGECLKNTIESPNMSDKVHHLLIELAPKNVIKIVTSLRDSLSHVEHLHKGKDDNESSLLDIQKDLIKLKDEINYLLFWKRNLALEIFFKRLSECENINQAKEIVSGVQSGESMKIHFSDKQNELFNKVAELIKKFEGEIVNPTDIQQTQFKKLEDIVEKHRLRMGEVKKEHLGYIKAINSLLSSIVKNEDLDWIRKSAEAEKNHLNFQTKSNKNFFDNVLESCYVIYNCVERRSRNINELFREIFRTVEFEGRRVKNIDRFKTAMAKEMTFDDEIEKTEKSEKKVNNILQNISEKFLDDQIKEQFFKEIEIKIDVFRSKNTLIKYYSKINDIYNRVISFFNILYENDQHLQENTYTKLIEENHLRELINQYFCENKFSLFDKAKKVKDDVKVASLIDEKGLKSLIEEIKRDLSLDENSFSAHICKVGLKFKKSETCETLFNDFSLSKCKTILNSLKRIDGKFDSFGKLVKDVLEEAEIAKLIEKFTEFIKSFSTNFSAEIINAIDEGFEQIKNEQLIQLKNYFFEKLEVLTKIFPNKRSDLELLALLKIDSTRIAVEMLVLNLTETLDQLSLFEPNRFYLDEFSPVLVGKNLRNYLAHGDPLINIIPTNYHTSLINHFRLFQREFHNEGDFYSGEHLIGKAKLENLLQVQQNYQQSLAILHKKYTVFNIIKSGEAENFNKLIDNCLYFKVRNVLGDTLLHYSARADNLSAFQHLLKQGLSLFLKNKYGQSALYLAVTTGAERIIEFLLAKGFDSSFTVKNSETLLHLAVQFGQSNIVKLLLSYGADIAAVDKDGFRPIIDAVLNGHSSIVNELLTAGSDVEWRDKSGKTLLHLATRNIEIVKTLLEKQVNVNAFDHDRNTPLHVACSTGDERVVKLLLDNRAKVNCRNKDGATALHYAAIEGHAKVVEQLLLTKKVDIDMASFKKITALHLACFRGHFEIVKLLLENGADLKMRNGVDMTALHIAAKMGHVRLIDIFLEYTGDIDCLGQGVTALHFAAESGATEMFKKLVEKGANMHLKGFNGLSVLHVAADLENVEMMEFMLEKEQLLGKSELVNLIDRKSRTAIYSAIETMKIKSLNFLLERNVHLNVEDEDKMTPLLFTALKDSAEMFVILLNKGADIEAKDGKGWSVLHAAAQNNNKTIVDRLIRLKVDVNDKTKTGITALHLASQYGHSEMVKLLLKNGADIDSSAGNGWTALHFASSYGHSEIVSYLLKKKAKNDFLDSYALTPVYLAAEQGHFGVLQLLLEDNNNYVNAIAENQVTVLEVAALNGNASCVELLLKNGADVNLTSQHDRTVLHHLAHKGNLEILKILLENQADANAKDKFGWTVLHLATEGGHFEVVKHLLLNKANPFIKSKEGESALHLASNSGFLNIVEEILLFDETEVDVVNSDKFTPLHWAAQSGHLEIVEFLLNKKANINSEDKNGSTSLHKASFNGHLETVRLLLDRGAAVHAPNVDGLSPLHCAALNGHLKVLIELLKFGADVNSKNTKNSTPLHLAVEKNNIDVVSHLLSDQNIKVNSIRLDGDTPLHLAAFKGLFDMAEMLIKAGANANSVDNQGYTPLHLAVQSLSCRIIKLLADNGADMNATFNDDISALVFAVRRGEINTVNALLENGAHVTNKSVQLAGQLFSVHIFFMLMQHGAGAREGTALHKAVKCKNEPILRLILGNPILINLRDAQLSSMVNAVDGDGRTPLISSAEVGYSYAVNLLLSFKSVKVNERATNGRTALHLSALNGHEKIVEMLISRRADANLRDFSGRTAFDLVYERLSSDAEKYEPIAALLLSLTD